MKMKVIFIGVVLMFFGIARVWSQNLEWVNVIDDVTGVTSNVASVVSTITDPTGNVYVAGNLYGDVDFGGAVLSGAESNIYLTKYTPNGLLLWAKGFYMLGNVVEGVRFDGNGQLLVYGRTGLLKCSLSGDLIWQKTTTFPIQFLQKANDGSLYAGFSVAYSSPVPEEDPVFDVGIAKMNATGDSLWVKRYAAESGVGSISAMTMDDDNKIYMMGGVSGNANLSFDEVPYNLYSARPEIYFAVLDSSGYVLSAKSTTNEIAEANIVPIELIFKDGYLFVGGYFWGQCDFSFENEPYILNPNQTHPELVVPSAFFGKYSLDGTVINLGCIELVYNEYMANAFFQDLEITNQNEIIIAGGFGGTVDFSPGMPGGEETSIMNIAGAWNNYLACYNENGEYLWHAPFNVNRGNLDFSVTTDAKNVYSAGVFGETVDFDPRDEITHLISTNEYTKIFVLKLNQENVSGYIFHDIDGNCQKDDTEVFVSNVRVRLEPSGKVATTDASGRYVFGGVSIGEYSIVVDTSLWKTNCLPMVLNVNDENELIRIEGIGVYIQNPCASPSMTINMPVARRCFDNQLIYTSVTNESSATNWLYASYTQVQLHPFMTYESSTIPATDLGNNLYRFETGDMYPGQSVNFQISVHVSCDAQIGQNLCVEANLYPVEGCMLDDIPADTIIGVTPCTEPWDKSSLNVEGWCDGDSVRFEITNTGDFSNGDMVCFAPVRVYLDGEFVMLDSIQLVGGETVAFAFEANGKTWRLEADQHPLHPGNSRPNAVVELCGDSSNWTPGFVNAQYQDDADPVVDIYCGTVTGSWDPNDKIGFPLGAFSNHIILQGQQLQYLIRFQNTGTDTAFTVVIRDTLSADFDIFSVTNGVSSHDCSFRMYGPRILEWRFDNILLPDSTINETESHGFVTFTVNQIPDLPLGTVLNNTAYIYFDYNEAVVTNTTMHTLGNFELLEPVNLAQTIADKITSFFMFPNPSNGIVNIYRANDDNANLHIIDMLGRVVYTQELDGRYSSINHTLPNGIYFITVKDGDGVSTKKLIIE